MVQGAKLLRTFLKKRGLPQAAVAKAMHVSAPSVHAWVNDDARPKAYLRDALELWTSGQVPAVSWDTPDERRMRRELRPAEPG